MAWKDAGIIDLGALNGVFCYADLDRIFGL